MATCERVFVKADSARENDCEMEIFTIPIRHAKQTVVEVIQELLEKLKIHENQPDKYELRLENSGALLSETSCVREVVKNDELLRMSTFRSCVNVSIYIYIYIL